MKIETFDSVWDAVSDTPEQAGKYADPCRTCNDH